MHRIVILSLITVTATASAQVVVTVDSSIKYQTIEGWGHGSAFLSTGWAAVDSVNYQYIDYLTDDWGLTGTRVNEVGAPIDGSGLDNGDCDSIDWTKFQPGPIHYLELMKYFSDRVKAEGFRPAFYSSTNYSSLAAVMKPWILNHPGERAEEIWASAMYYRDHYGLDMDYAVIMNEPSGVWSPQLIADDIKALGPRFLAHGLATKSQYPECVAPQTAWSYITPVRNDLALWPFIGRISYHNYGTADPYRSYIRDFGDSIGIRTAQTEMDPANIDNLFDDLIKGGVSYWEVAYTNASTVNANPGYTSFTPTRYYFRDRQVLHYVRPGAVRIGSTSTDSIVRVLPFLKDGRLTTVVYNTSAPAKTITVNGIPPGTYGVSQAASGVIAFQELGVKTVGADGAMTLTLNGGSAATIYPYTGPNHPPTIMTWGSTPGVLHLPATTSSLAVTANDPELDSLTYHWSIVSQPAGATSVFAKPDAATTNVSGLTAEGTYVFNVDVSDGINTVSRKSYLIVYATNQPPAYNYTGFRLSSPYGVILDIPKADGTPLRTSITLPTMTGILQANISDLENDALKGQWTIVSQPVGATATIDSTIYIFVSFRSQIHNMSVPGDYVFQITASDPTNPPITARVICTVLPQNTPPKIDSIAATPRVITLPIASTQLSAVTTDAEHDLLRHWWAVKKIPAGASPQFDHQGLPNTHVGNLTVPGSYTFTLRAFDDISMTTRDVTVVVNNTSDVADNLIVPHTLTLGQNIPNPVQSHTTIPFTLAAPGLVTLKLYDVFGREVTTVLDEPRSAGSQSAEVNTDMLSGGRYAYRLSVGRDVVCGSMVVVR